MSDRTGPINPKLLVPTTTAPDSTTVENKDDWEINHNDTNINYNLKVPSFIRLFVIHRTLCKYINYDDTKRKEDTHAPSKSKSFFEQVEHFFKGTPEDPKQILIDDLISVFNDHANPEIKSIAKLILERLLNDGIKQYMQKWYNEEKQANIIEMIFHEIILKKFRTTIKYNQVLVIAQTDDKNNDRYYHNLVFNSSDLMTSIFEYLEWGRNFDDDLFCCSLVNSGWLYHSWNVNSVYYVDLTTLLSKQLACARNIYEDNITRLWQRLVRAKSVYIFLEKDYIPNFVLSDVTLKLLLNRLGVLKNIQKLNLTVMIPTTRTDLILRTIMSISKDRIKHCDTTVKPFTTQWVSRIDISPQLSPLMLPNVKSIIIRDSYFYHIWSNKCEKITLQLHDNKITKDCCQFWIDHCDCSNVKTLELNNTRFDINNKSLLKHLACKFINLKNLNLVFLNGDFDSNVMIFWYFLKPIILENNVQVQLNLLVYYDNNTGEYAQLNQIMKRYDLKIERLNVSKTNPKVIEFIQQRDECGLQHLKACTTNVKELVDKVSFKSITSFDFCGSLKEITDFLGFDVIVNKRLFVTVDEERDYIDTELFEPLCQNICKLVQQQIPINIKIIFNDVNEIVFKSCYQIYSSYFENNCFLAGYSEPKCKSQLCVTRAKFHSYLIVYGTKRMALRVKNVTIMNSFS